MYSFYSLENKYLVICLWVILIFVIALRFVVVVVSTFFLSKSWRYYNMSRCLHNVVHGA